jgi:hypothetical protein
VLVLHNASLSVSFHLSTSIYLSIYLSNLCALSARNASLSLSLSLSICIYIYVYLVPLSPYCPQCHSASIYLRALSALVPLVP